jgi:hypothetical protein
MVREEYINIGVLQEGGKYNFNQGGIWFLNQYKDPCVEPS